MGDPLVLAEQEWG